jgi:para-aminobenzoate synthetase component 1
MQRILRDTGSIESIHREPIELPQPFPEFAGRFAGRTGTVVLLSGGGQDSGAWNVLALRPWLRVTARDAQCRLESDTDRETVEEDPFALLKRILQAYGIEGQESPGPGLFGYFAYDLKDQTENLPRTSVDDLGLPHLCLFAPSLLLVQDVRTGKSELIAPVRSVGGRDRLAEDLGLFRSLAPGRGEAEHSFRGAVRGLRAGFTRASYERAVADIRSYIAAGHVYQVNMSQRFETDFRGDPYGLFLELFRDNPAPFFAYVNAGDHQVVSSSPERFLRLRGRSVETRPIKGTRPRGATPQEDRDQAGELASSPKDDAELSMIVDLMRNDLGRSCVPGSVRVQEHKRLEAYRNVFHLVSVVRGELEPGLDATDLLKNAFPGGSITGCPKIRAMEIIDELEPVRRHVYTGSIGYMGFSGDMDLSIAIRTATVLNGSLLYSVGGGVVYDSDPGEEFEETLHKGSSIRRALGSGASGEDPERTVWQDGVFVPPCEASVSPFDPGLAYGFGLFETLRADRGRILRLDRHIERLNRSWRKLMPHPPPDLSWDRILRELLARNCLLDDVAAVKILATAGQRHRPPYRHRLVASAQPYAHRVRGRGEPGLRLQTAASPRQTHLADHKTLNHLYYHLAGREAVSRGADEALVLNPDGSVSETNSANLLLASGPICIRPSSPHVLPGVSAQAAAEILAGRGYEIIARPVYPEELFRCDVVLAVNSLMGAVPVLSLDDSPLPRSRALAESLNLELLGRAGPWEDAGDVPGRDPF